MRPVANYSKRQLERGNGRKCGTCCSEVRLSNLTNSPDVQTGRTQGDVHLNSISFDGKYYTGFDPDKSNRIEKKKREKQQNLLRIDNDPLSPSNPLGINQYTDAAKPFILLSSQVQEERLREVKTDLKNSCDDVVRASQVVWSTRPKAA